MQYLGNREDAEDVLHDGFIKIIRKIGSFKKTKTGSLEAWMRRIMVNTALKYIRDHKRERMTANLDKLLDNALELDGNDDFDESGVPPDFLMKLICELPIGYRTVFNLHVMEDYTHKEIGNLLGITENTSKSQLSKARALLRKRILEYQIETNYEKAVSSR